MSVTLSHAVSSYKSQLSVKTTNTDLTATRSIIAHNILPNNPTENTFDASEPDSTSTTRICSIYRNMATPPI